jgi:hypothetical protein
VLVLEAQGRVGGRTLTTHFSVIEAVLNHVGGTRAGVALGRTR